MRINFCMFFVLFEFIYIFIGCCISVLNFRYVLLIVGVYNSGSNCLVFDCNNL